MTFSLANLGWQAFFQQQLSLHEWEITQPVRLIGQQRDQWRVMGEQGELLLQAVPDWQPCVGDWLLLQQGRPERLLERQSLFQRSRPGKDSRTQLIAANVDTALLVMALNHDFNLNRLERYLALVHEAGVQPVVVLTRADQSDAIVEHVAQVQRLDTSMPVLAFNALDADDVRQQLHAWCATGQTLALLGSSGVGKSTIANALSDSAGQLTSGIRDDDSKGRHTTTSRSLLPLASGAWLMDTPGMRELQLTQCQAGLSSTFSDVEQLAAQCRFSDCGHGSEPGCAVREAIEAGELELRRWQNYLKLQREEARNSASLAQRRASAREFARHAKTIVAGKRIMQGQNKR
ncbi:ribosome small subunit-dependent GTPase A [Bacterioplanes sanyensis]|uniref:Small ribosomal subunit biogenesis GTPase RsgA n=1 Tax=Bacterioplanes sanyensis TaxID=1249553 RepID=A0A222FLH1_9GAMM|nr:ribosome small subunit-dependent GTPase A [Bacterioplanes sanyensis]ASP39446.1 ribosome small subunit-dependent GTPase A [Bacterioplanes sanyensis]